MTPGQRGGIIFKLLLLLVLLVLLGLVYLLRHPLLRVAGEYWVVDESPQTADAILLLSEDNFSADRATRAAELYRQGWAPRIVASGVRLRPYATVADFMQRDLAERGVSADAVVRFSHTADSTREEAQALRSLVVERDWRRTLVVTSNYHTRRTRYIFRRVFPPRVEVRVVAARDSGYDPDRWWESRHGQKLFLRETLGFCWAIWELRHVQASSTEEPASRAAPAHP
jgi:uncharacterized SAM-binding protein YcdF (DUF218 family)